MTRLNLLLCAAVVGVAAAAVAATNNQDPKAEPKTTANVGAPKVDPKTVDLQPTASNKQSDEEDGEEESD